MRLREIAAILVEMLGDAIETVGTGITRTQLHQTIHELVNRNSELRMENQRLREALEKRP